MSLLRKTDLEVSFAICKLIPGNEEIIVESQTGAGDRSWGKRHLALVSHPSENHGELVTGWYVGDNSPVRQMISLKGQAIL